MKKALSLLALVALLTSCTSGIRYDAKGMVEGYTASKSVDNLRQ